MFKQIGSTLEKRVKEYKIHNSTQQDIQTRLFKAIPFSIRVILQIGDIRYDHQKGCITLVAHHRAAANELTLQLDKIYKHAYQAGIQFSRIRIATEQG